MTVLVTGGTGFIGGRLAQRCLKQGMKVRVFAQVNTEAQSDMKDQLDAAGADICLGSITDDDARLGLCDGVEVVYHLAAAQHEANVPDEHFWRVNTDGTKALLDEAVAAGVQRFVFASTIGVYGEGGTNLDERSVTNPTSAYGASKLAAEGHVLGAASEIHSTVIRVSETYGPGDRRLLKLFRAIGKERFRMVGAGSNLHHMIFVDDLIDAFLLASGTEHARGEVFAIAGSRPVTTLELAEAIANSLGKGLSSRHIPIAAIGAVAATLETLLRPLGIQPPVHRRSVDFFTKTYAFSTERASALLGFEPVTDLQSGVEATRDWYRQNHLL
ncbi:MAG: NAD(P)-dependent oxidoreductase [Pseudomonadota bacterium]